MTKNLTAKEPRKGSRQHHHAMESLRILDLEIFIRAADASSFSAAARELGLSPAVVSKRIGVLETVSGALLFKRNTRRMEVTGTGRRLYARVAPFLKAMNGAEAFLRGAGEFETSAPAAALAIPDSALQAAAMQVASSSLAKMRELLLSGEQPAAAKVAA